MIAQCLNGPIGDPIQVIDPVTTPDAIYKNYNISAMIKDKYKTYLNRNADQGGLTFWEGWFKVKFDQLGYEQAVMALNKEFQNSVEYKQKKALAKVNNKKVPVPEIKTDNLIGFDGKI